MMASSVETAVVVVGGIVGGVCNIGAVGFLIRYFVGKLDKHQELLPKISESIAANTVTQQTIAKSQEAIASSLEELYHSRNDHEGRLIRVETIQENTGCSTGGRRAYDPAKRRLHDEV